MRAQARAISFRPRARSHPADRSPVPDAVQPTLVTIRPTDVRVFWDDGAARWAAERTRFLRPPAMIETSWPGATRILLVTVDDVSAALLDCARFTAADFAEMLRHLRLVESTGVTRPWACWTRLRVSALWSPDAIAPRRSVG